MDRQAIYLYVISALFFLTAIWFYLRWNKLNKKEIEDSTNEKVSKAKSWMHSATLISASLTSLPLAFIYREQTLELVKEYRQLAIVTGLLVVFKVFNDFFKFKIPVVSSMILKVILTILLFAVIWAVLLILIFEPGTFSKKP